jgi:hypothetical protein
VNVISIYEIAKVSFFFLTGDGAFGRASGVDWR